ncbi:hemolysin family protein [Halodesulfurarchaeum sp.]|uniref:hemolysin family protein n=1 Tax=Halodesulfurarchaeum sp. TaxID=1980530 RepID=UPI002FC3487F
MVNVALSLGQLFLALFLVVLNGFFVAAEFAFVRVRSTSVEQLAAEGRTGSKALQGVMDKLDDYLAVTQLGITIASLGLGWVGEPAIATLIEPVVGSLLPQNLVHLVAFAIAFGIITFLHVVFGELAPKTLAIAQAERLALFVAAPMTVFYYLFYPGIIVFNGTANAFTQLLGVPPASETDETLEEREILRVLSRSGEEGHVDMAEVEMIERVFDLDDTVVREIMVPRPDVVTVPKDATLAEFRETVLEAGHTRYPVVEEDEDQIAGFLDVKDVLRATGESGEADQIAGDLARDLLVVPEATPINDLLLQFRSERQQVAAVIDEWGAFEGLVTVEDAVEAIVGDLRDEFDTDETDISIQQQAKGEYVADGSVPLGAVNETLDVHFESESYETIGGVVLDELGHAPGVGETVERAGYRFEVTGVDGNRISTLRITVE